MKLRLVVVAAASVLATSLLSASSEPASDSHGLLVVTANLREAYDKQDLADMHEMVVFTARLLDRVPRDPDILLLQEVRHSSAAFVARLLTKATGARFTVVVDPGRRPARRLPSRSVFRNTAIVINRETTRALAQGGFIGNAHGRRVGKNAYTLVTRRGASTKIALMSLHLMPHRSLATKRWVVKDASLLRRKYPDADLKVMAGDFNADRCLEFKPNCLLAPFYRELVRDRPYIDVVRAVAARRRGGVDYIFASGRPIAAGVDLDGKGRYSDHVFRWGITAP
jgi:endonuclease/exonuclease/phosphatase family metal-dependent hydrolase